MFSKLQNLWDRLPKSLRYLATIILLYALLFAIFDVVDLLQLDAFTTIAVATTLTFLVAIVATLRTAEPPKVVAAAENERGKPKNFLARWEVWLGLGGIVTSAGLMWFAVWLIAPEDVERQFDAVFLVVSTLLFVLFVLPVLCAVIGLTVGIFLRSKKLEFEYVIHVPTTPEEAWHARADVNNVALYGTNYSKIERLTGYALPTFKLTTDWLVGRVLGLDQTIIVQDQRPGERLVLQSQSRHGDEETEKFEFKKGTERDKTQVSVRGRLKLRGPFTKLMNLLLGPTHLVRGSAYVEAMKFSRALMCDATVSDLSTTILVERRN